MALTASLVQGILLDTIGGANITVTTGAKSVDGINKILIGIGTGVGAVLIVIAVIKLVMAISSEQAAGKSQAGMMLGTGVFFMSMAAVVNSLGINNLSNQTADQMAKNVITIICTLCTYAGGAFAIIGILDLILSIVNEQPEGKANAAKFLGGAAGLLAANALGTTIKGHIGGTTDANSIVKDVGSFLGKTASYIGAVFVLMGIWYLINSIRQEESRERDVAIRFFIAGIGLIAARAVLINMGLAS